MSNRGDINTVEEVDLTTFESRKLLSSGKVLLACLHDEQAETGQHKLLVELLQTERNLDIVKADDDSLEAFARRYQILGTPTYLLFTGGLERNRFLGMADANSLKRLVHDTARESGPPDL